jgi:hypothetical protein
VVGDQLRVRFVGDMVASEDCFALFCALSPEAACNLLERRLGPERPDALDKLSRQNKQAELEVALEIAERTEEAAIEASAREGTEVMRRADANPLCVLGLMTKQINDQQRVA